MLSTGDAADATAMATGSLRYARARRSTPRSNVAENSSR